MAFHVSSRDPQGNKTSKRFFDRYSAEQEARRLREEGHADVLVDLGEIKNWISMFLIVVGCVVILVGLILSLSLDHSSLVLAGFYILSSIFAGALLIGLSEVVSLLDQINKKQKK
ncbi:hypothetical protein ACFQZT_12655 [Paenibacillus sp. GCM10027628]|uniref:hypothetical protein n=1 Tax=Paenibacillus sp. GCM10027628 TaxID=3273413 RepID=UPI003633E927